MKSTLAKDKRFVQILMLAMGETPLGRRHFWPIYAAAERQVCRSASTPAVPTVIQ